MVRISRIPAFLVIAALGLTSCVPSVRGPGDDYSLEIGQASEDELSRARAAIADFPQSPQAAQGAFILARESYRAGDLAGLDRQLSWMERNHPESELFPPLLYLRLVAASKTEGIMRLMQRMDAAIAMVPDDPIFAQALRDLLAANLPAASESDLTAFLAGAPTGILASEALLALGRLKSTRGEIQAGAAVLRRLVTEHPDSAAAPEAFLLLKELSRQIPTDPRLIGALLPLTGSGARYGKSVRQALELAVEDFKTAGEEFSVAVFDTRKDPEMALDGLNELVNRRLVIALFGPLFSGTALLCAAEANSLGVAMLTPSAQAFGLTRTGPYVFRTAMTLETEAGAMAEFALERGFERFGILSPDTPYGRSLADSFRARVASHGGTVLAEASYPSDASDMREAIVALGGADIAAFKELGEEFDRAAQIELEVFLRDFFRQASALPGLLPSATIQDEAGPIRVACLVLGNDPFSAEMANRLRAAALSHRALSILAPENVSSFAAGLDSALVRSEGPHSSHAELVLGEILETQFEEREAGLSILVSADVTEVRPEAQVLSCALAMYDSRLAHRLAGYEFSLHRPVPPSGNTFRLEAIYLPASGSQVLQIIPQLVYHSIDLPILGSETWLDSALQKKPEAVTLEAYFTASFWPGLEQPLTQRFVSRYQERFAEPPDSLAANAYDSARLLMLSILKSDGSRESVRESLLSGTEIEGLAGKLRIAADREAEREPAVLRIREGIVSLAR